MTKRSSRKAVEYELVSKFKTMIRGCLKEPKDEYDIGFNEGLGRAVDVFIDCVGDFVPAGYANKDAWVAECTARFDLLVGSQYDLSDAYLAHDVGVRRGLDLAKKIFAEFAAANLGACECSDAGSRGSKRKTLGIGLWSIFCSMLDENKEKYASSVFDHGINQGLESAAEYFRENAEKYVQAGEGDDKEIWRAGCISVYGSDIDAMKTRVVPHYNADRVNAVNAGLERSKEVFAEFADEMWPQE